MKLVFDVTHLYYLPQYIPIYKMLLKKNVDCHFMFYRNEQLADVIDNAIKKLNLPFSYVDSEKEALDYYKQ